MSDTITIAGTATIGVKDIQAVGIERDGSNYVVRFALRGRETPWDVRVGDKATAEQILTGASRLMRKES